MACPGTIYIVDVENFRMEIWLWKGKKKGCTEGALGLDRQKQLKVNNLTIYPTLVSGKNKSEIYPGKECSAAKVNKSFVRAQQKFPRKLYHHQ